MTSPKQLVPGKPSPVRLELAETGPESAATIRSIYTRIWAPLKAHGRLQWSDEEWVAELSHPAVRSWLALVEGETAGFVELENGTKGDVGIVVFGVAPEYQDKGLGAAFLVRATELAWEIGNPTPTARVWLQTSSDDHPHALTNYQHRGFRTFSTETSVADVALQQGRDR
ncbi:GNAT family N-acetyltransferase [Streptomyces sp. SID13031]|uniref:GNAT family N-acetyltransferase n=1 Tax=Streptomyces sp. SID13031 TaxID=2706046 RepID=UPI0013CC6BDB|nr:GNAT family N-acetyltransferase [Streptomyces sp. SID13031]NEA33330.1 GNAT family N-acetyltransferase [Streptomyces sp. SID13031]